MPANCSPHSLSRPEESSPATYRSDLCPRAYSRFTCTASRALSQKSSPRCSFGSNNYIANQVFLEIGAHRLGGPVSLNKSLQVVREILADHGLAGTIHLEEGSGISRENHFTARGLATLLKHFAPHAALLSGTSGGSRYKTGTIPGVRTLAGYANTSEHGQVRFVISLGGNTGKMRFRLLRAIERGL
jgi:D-alanyl-D-alanine carboxypeptidase/D-alanyl-D-alanine-endopeptidase (penicillin-binding protein 4)